MYNDIKDLPLLTQAEEFELYEKIQKGNKEAKEKLILHNMRLAAKLANKYRDCGISFDDILQEAMLGLTLAATKFDAHKGRFAAYAGRAVENQILMMIRKQPKVIIHSLDAKLEDERNDFFELFIDPEAEKDFGEIDFDNMINSLESEEARYIMQERYQNNKTYNQIADELNCSYTKVRYVEHNALKKLKY